MATNLVQPQEGMYVQNRQPINRFPHFLIDEVGKTGTVVEVSKNLIGVKMDDYIEGCEQWDNVIQLLDNDFGDYGNGVVLSTMQELFNYYFEPIPAAVTET